MRWGGEGKSESRELSEADTFPDIFMLVVTRQARGIGLGLLLTLCSQPFMRTGCNRDDYHKAFRCFEVNKRSASRKMVYIKHLVLTQLPPN